MNSKRSISRIAFDLFSITLILTLLIGSAASPTDASAASLTTQVDSKSVQVSGKQMQPRAHQTALLQVVTFAPLADSCTDSCAQAQADNITSCTNALGPDVCPECGDALTQCLADIEESYTTCTASCAVPPVSCATCDQNLADAIAVCNSSYDINVCGGEPACVADMSSLLDTCIADANTAFSACTESCTLSNDDGGGDEGGDESGDEGSGGGDEGGGDAGGGEGGGDEGGGGEQDSDLDGVSDSIDNCPSIANSNQFDVDGDGLGDVCDPFPLDTTNQDNDGDGVSELFDNCPSVANTDQSDMDGDGLGDVCDPTPNVLIDQSITVTRNAPTSVYAGDEFRVEASASSGLSVTYSAYGDCTNVNEIFTINENDSTVDDICYVRFSQGGDATYNPALPVTQEVTYLNTAPSIDEGDSITVTMSQDGTPIVFSLLLHASDKDVDPLNWSISSPSSNGLTIIGKNAKCTSHAPADPNNPKVKFSCKAIVYTPTSGYSGTDSFEVEVSDGELTDTITVNVIIEKTNTSVVTLLDSQGNGLEGATVQYYLSGWQNIPGSTDADGELSYDGLGLSGSLTFRITYANASIQKQQNITDDPTVIFQTQLVSMQLLASDGSSDLNGDAQYYSNGWRTFGSGSTSTNMELLPLNYTFRVSYGGASIQKQQNVANDSAVIFQTKLASMQLLASDGTTELTGTSQYYANGWKTFGSGSTSATMELLPVNYTFRVSYGGASIQKQQDVNTDAAVLFQTKLASMQLLASNGTTELTGIGEYYANGWKTFGSGSISATMELLPVNYTFRVSYGGASIQKQQDVNINPLVVFQTKLVTMKLVASDGTTELPGTGQYYANGWKNFSNGSTTTSMELLPVNYTFRVSYGGASVQKVQDVSANQLVVFQTGQVHSTSATATQYYANGWKTFTQDMELLPGSYAFKFNDGTPQTTYPLSAGIANIIH